MSSDACATRQGFSSFRTFSSGLQYAPLHPLRHRPGNTWGRKAREIFGPRGISGGVNSTGRRLQQEGQGHSGGVAAKAAACEDISYYNEKMLSQQTCLLAYRKTPPQHF